MDWLAPAVKGLARVSNIAGAAGLPFATMVGTVLDQGLNLYKFANGGGRGGVGGVERSIGVTALKETLVTGFTKMCAQVEDMKTDLDKMQTVATKTFEMIQEMHYLDGIENIDFAHAVFFKRNSNMEESLASFKSHQFELEKQYMQHLNPWKIIRFLKMLGERGEGAPEKVKAMFNYVLTVEAKYLQMMCIFHIHKQDIESLTSQYELFTSHYNQLTDAMGPTLEEQVTDI